VVARLWQWAGAFSIRIKVLGIVIGVIVLLSTFVIVQMRGVLLQTLLDDLAHQEAALATGVAIPEQGRPLITFMLAGSASTNPVLFLAALGLMFAWKIGGFIGLDYFLLNLIGTPWNRKVTDTEVKAERRAQIAPAEAGD
jgi:hypothetical protein